MKQGSFKPASKKLFKMERDRQHIKHQQRLRNMSAHVDTSKPHSYETPAFNMKKLQIIEERQTEIERENQALLQKITYIMNADKGVQQKQNPVRFQKTGINEVKRKNELLKITMENQHILKRIKDKKSAYDARQLAQEYQKHKYYKKNLCEYPIVLDDFQTSENNGQSKYNNEKLLTEGSEYHGSDVNTSVKYIQQKKNVNTILEPVDNRQGEIRILAKKSKKIGINLYIIEITVLNGIFKITADDVENPLTRVLEMHENDGYKVVNDFCNGSIDNLIDNLKITDKIYIKGLEKYQEQQQSPQKEQKQPQFYQQRQQQQQYSHNTQSPKNYQNKNYNYDSRSSANYNNRVSNQQNVKNLATPNKIRSIENNSNNQQQKHNYISNNVRNKQNLISNNQKYRSVSQNLPNKNQITSNQKQFQKQQQQESYNLKKQQDNIQQQQVQQQKQQLDDNNDNKDIEQKIQEIEDDYENQEYEEDFEQQQQNTRQNNTNQKQEIQNDQNEQKKQEIQEIKDKQQEQKDVTHENNENQKQQDLQQKKQNLDNQIDEEVIEYLNDNLEEDIPEQTQNNNINNNNNLQVENQQQQQIEDSYQEEIFDEEYI